MNLSQILVLNTDKNADQKLVFDLLEEYKAQSADIVMELFELIYSGDEQVSYLASMQAKFLLRKYLGFKSEYLYDLSYSFLKNMHSIPNNSKKYLLPTICKILAHIFFQGAFDQLPALIQQSIQENPVDMIQVTAALYLCNKNSQLNDALCRLLLNLLKYTQELPLQLIPLISQLDETDQMIIHMANTQIFLSALSWEDFPDYFEANIQQILQYLMDVIQLESESKLKNQINENCLDALFNLLSNHYEEIQNTVSDLIDVLVQFMDGQNDFMVVKIIKELNRYYESPELGALMKQKDQAFVASLIKHLTYSEDDQQLADSFDTLFTQAYCQEKDRNSKVCEAQIMMQSILTNSPGIIDQIQTHIQENYQSELFQCISMLRTVVIGTQSVIHGLQLRNESSVETVQNFFTLLYHSFQSFNSFNQLHKGELIKFGFDFFQFLTEEQQKQFLGVTSVFTEQYAQKNQFAAVVFCYGVSNLISKQEVSISYVNQLIPSLAQINQMLNFENESACKALCVCIQKSSNVDFFQNVESIILQLLKKQMQQGLVQFCNLCLEMFPQVDDTTKYQFCDKLINLIPMLENEFEESMVFILQLLAFFLKFVSHEGLRVVLNACLTHENYIEHSDLTKAMLIFVNQALVQEAFGNSEFVQVKLNLSESAATQIRQTDQLLILLQELIQKQSTAAFAYETLNLVMNYFDPGQEVIQSVVAYNFKYRNQLINNKQLCKQSTLFFCNVINKYFEAISNCNINIYDLITDVLTIGCQGAFGIKDKKAFICTQILKLVTPQTQKQVKRALGYLLRKVRTENYLKEFKEAQTVDVIVLNSLTDYIQEEDDPKDLDQLCLEALGETNWKV